VPRIFIRPAVPTTRRSPPSGDAWLHEVKFDGYRCQLHKAAQEAVIFSKNGCDFTQRFPNIRAALLTLSCRSAIIDGEVVACKQDGTPDFRALHSGKYALDELCTWCFDLMELNGEDLRPLPLVARKQKLTLILRRHEHPYLRNSEPFKYGEQLLAECRQCGLEGIVSKRRHAPYKSGKCDWIKVKCAEWKEEHKFRGFLFGQGR
jgi:bifunctional non-homologous end joining protein LigD